MVELTINDKKISVEEFRSERYTGRREFLMKQDAEMSPLLL